MSTTITMLRLAAAAALGLAASQGCDSAASECTIGSQGCACAQDEACLGDLQCLSEICVPPADDDPAGDGGSPAADADAGGDGADDAGADGDGGDDDAGTSDAPSDDPTVCERLLGCLADTNPAALPEALAAYGPDGTCWADGSLTEVCITACAGLLGDYSRSTDAESCRECSVPADCSFFDGGDHCLAGSCVQCIDDSHCPTAQPLCVTTVGGPVCTTADTCNPDEFACPQGGCIPSYYYCDGDFDCPSGADEVC